jgi:hypothetical protein
LAGFLHINRGYRHKCNQKRASFLQLFSYFGLPLPFPNLEKLAVTAAPLIPKNQILAATLIWILFPLPPRKMNPHPTLIRFTAPQNNLDADFFEHTGPTLEGVRIPTVRGAYDPPTSNGVVRLRGDRGAYEPPTSNGVVRPGAYDAYDPPTSNGVVRPGGNDPFFGGK